MRISPTMQVLSDGDQSVNNTSYIAEFEELVLMAILMLRENAYGAAIHEALEEAGRGASIGALYTTLSRLETKGLVSSWFGEPTASRGGRAKKFFKVDSTARDALANAAETRRRLAVGLRPDLVEAR